MPTVAVNPPKTPVTQGSHGIACATLPNICKMPGPPAPFVPTPLPNIGKSENSPSGYSTSVKIEGQPVAIKGATFNSMGDVASQGTGGGLISMNVQGPTSFVGPGSMDVMIEGKNVQLLGDPMLNNGGPSGTPANAATMAGLLQAPEIVASATARQEIRCAIKACDKKNADGKNYPKGLDCKSLGQKKHQCVRAKVNGKEGISCDPFVIMTKPPKLANTDNVWHAMARASKALGKSSYTPGTGMLRKPDTLYRDGAGKLKIIDAKFPCEGDPSWGKGQKKDYEKMVGKGNVDGVSPADVTDEECP
jgi:uncharacterized Zn-binding protein involved in type VI secretion